MSAGFKVAGELFWGTNGAVETYVETMGLLADSHYGAYDPLTVYLAEQRECFSAGLVLYLDEWLADIPDRIKFLELLDATTERLLGQGTFIDYGREWVTSVVVALRAKIAALDYAKTDASADGGG
jgi:hypothetical protein